MKRFYLFIIQLLLISGNINSQDTQRISRLMDSLSILKEDTVRVTVLRQLGNLYYSIQPDSAIYFTKKGLELAEKLNWTKGIAQCSLNLGNDFIYVSKYDSAIFYETKALDPAIRLGDSNRIALIYINRGAAYTETHQYQKGLADISTAMRIAEKTGNKERQARASQSICELYMYQDNYEAALPWAKKALQLETALGDEMQQGIAEMSVGGLYALKNNYAEAETYLLDAVHKLNKTHRPDMIIECALSLSDVYLNTKKYPDAIAILQQGLTNAQQLHLIDRASIVYASLGNVYLETKQHAEALQAYQKGCEVVKADTAFQKNQYICLAGMAKASDALGNYKNAFEYLTASNSIKDTVMRKMQDSKLLELQTAFETERKEKEIELLKKNHNLSILEVQHQRDIKSGVIVVSALLLVIALLGIARYRTVQKAKRMLEIETLRNNIARDLHDDIGSALSSININSKIALHNATEEAFIKNQLEKIQSNSVRTMEGMSDIVWAIHPDNDSLEKIVTRMKEFAAELLEPLQIEYSFEINIQSRAFTLDITKRKEIYLIFKEALNNAAKYSEGSSIIIRIEKSKEALQLEVIDNGKGFVRHAIKMGNGLKNMEHRAKALGGSLEFISNKGTIVRLTVPIT
ncbi:MAG: tetratricopeptide repeat protein [Agriterribacter sp.]